MENYSNVDEYLNSLREEERKELERVRNIIKNVQPEAVELISYGMPGFKFKGKYLIGFAAFKNHLSLFPTPGPIEALKDSLDGFVLAKGTIQFTLDNTLSEDIIKKLVDQRTKEIYSE